MARTDAMAKAMHAKDTDSFWKTVPKSYKKGIPNTSNVNVLVAFCYFFVFKSYFLGLVDLREEDKHGIM